MMDEELVYPPGEHPELPGEVIIELRQRRYCYHHPCSDQWRLGNMEMGIVEGLIASLEG